MRSRGWVLLLVGLCSGCFLFGGGGGQSDPCDDDRFGCEGFVGDDSAFELDPTCTLDGDLVVEVGSGDGGYAPLQEGSDPPIFSGSQGGQHTVVGVRIENPALDRYDMLRVELGMFTADQCPAAEEDTLTEPCEGDPANAARIVVLGQDSELVPTDDGAVEEHGMVLFLPGASDLVMQAIVEDPCGRRGIARHRLSF